MLEVVATAKTDLKAGQVVDGIGYYMTYGLCENATTAAEQNLLPIGVAEGCVLKHDIPKDQVLTYDDVILPEGRTVDRLREEQAQYFGTNNAADREQILKHQANKEVSLS